MGTSAKLLKKEYTNIHQAHGLDAALATIYQIGNADAAVQMQEAWPAHKAKIIAALDEIEQANLSKHNPPRRKSLPLARALATIRKELGIHE